MKTILYMTLTANGRFAQATGSHPVPKEILGDFVGVVAKVGNLIVGSRTYDLMRSIASRRGIPKIKLVVVTRDDSESEVATAASPQEALRLLERDGFDSCLVGGGAQLDSTFLSQGLVDEVYLNIEPSVTKRNMCALSEGFEAELRLVGVTRLSDNVVQLHYDRVQADPLLP
jgi:dihydrofolate reductase